MSLIRRSAYLSEWRGEHICLGVMLTRYLAVISYTIVYRMCTNVETFHFPEPASQVLYKSFDSLTSSVAEMDPSQGCEVLWYISIGDLLPSIKPVKRKWAVTEMKLWGKLDGWESN